jgi:hypothetical protein
MILCVPGGTAFPAAVGVEPGGVLPAASAEAMRAGEEFPPVAVFCAGATYGLASANPGPFKESESSFKGKEGCRRSGNGDADPLEHVRRTAPRHFLDRAQQAHQRRDLRWAGG